MVRTFDPRQVIISLGSHIVTGYSDGTFISIEPGGDGIVKKVGCDGEVGRGMDPDRTATMTLTLLLVSPSVGFCHEQYIRDQNTHGEGTFPVLVKDLKGGLVFSADTAWVVTPPTREFDKEMPDREIQIDCGDSTWEGDNW